MSNILHVNVLCFFVLCFVTVDMIKGVFDKYNIYLFTSNSIEGIKSNQY